MQMKLGKLLAETKTGEKRQIEPGKDGRGQKYEFELAGYHFFVRDMVKKTEESDKENQEYFITRRIVGKRKEASGKKEGIALSMYLEFGEETDIFRVGIPSAVYGAYVSREESTYHSFMEDRLTGVMLLLFDEDHKKSTVVQKMNPAKYIEKEERKRGEGRYLHKTETTSIGYGFGEAAYVKLCWPYEEREKSVALDSMETPAQAFYPLEEEQIELVLEYRVAHKECKTFTDGLYQEYQELSRRLVKRGEKTVRLPFSREEGIQLRRKCVGRTYREFGPDGAGFFFDFDPEYGYESEPSGFGTSFHTIPHKTYTHILEYGFTGRQLNIALDLAMHSEDYFRKAERVIDFFVNYCITENGWVYSLYDTEKGAPFASFGDASAPRLHYMYYEKCKGNYLRTMTEPMLDLLEAYLWYRKKGVKKEKWLESVIRFANFLLEKQNADGSWCRAYSMTGEPVYMNDREDYTTEENDRGRKASTIIPVMFLCALANCLGEEKYLQSAKKAGNYALEHEVRWELYQGGTMDNPNVVDKEASQYMMAGLYHLYQMTKSPEYLEGALCAAKQFVTWNYIWNAPMRKGNILFSRGFCTKGMGAINSIWCGGVVDIYSLFHIRELYLLGKEAEESFLIEMAEDISIATQQILSWSGDTMGFCDSGMQPEGFGICPQGMDEGMIEKGDIWGTLGWIYSAGISGMERYLKVIT